MTLVLLFALPAEAACTGFLRRAAERLAEDAALVAAEDAVEDAGDPAAFIAALTRAAAGRIYNLVGDESVTVGEIADMVRKLVAEVLPSFAGR